jgi:hypothetical protein
MKFSRTRDPGWNHPGSATLPIRKWFFFFSFSANHEKNFRTFCCNYLNQRHFELYSNKVIQKDIIALGRIRIFSELRSGQNGPDPPLLLSQNRPSNFASSSSKKLPIHRIWLLISLFQILVPVLLWLPVQFRCSFHPFWISIPIPNMDPDPGSNWMWIWFRNRNTGGFYFIRI